MPPRKYSKWKFDSVTEKNDYRFDGNTLRMFVNLLLSTENPNIRRSDYSKLKTLIENLNLEYYVKDDTKMFLVKLIKIGLEVFERYQFPTKGMMITALYDIIAHSDDTNFRELNDDEIKFISSYINSCVSQNYFYKRVDDLLEILTSAKTVRPIDREKVIDQACVIMREIVVDHEMIRNEDRDSYFDLEDENFTKTMKSVYETLSQSSHRLKTGMVGFNELLGGGLESGRAYMVIAPSCEGKSGFLLDLAVQLKEANPNIVTKDPTLKPCIAYLTQENAMSETLERLWNITTVPGEDLTAYDLDDVMGRMKSVGGMVMDENNNTNLAIVYRKPFTNTTFWFYEFLEEMRNRGYEVVCLIHDYIQRIHSASEEARKELRLELGAIMNEECTLAKRMNISFVTVGQINRGANNKLTDMRLKQAIDRVSNMGQSDIAESIQIIYNADVVFAMAREKDPMSGIEYLGFNKIKGRDRRKIVSNTVYQPVDSKCPIRCIRDLSRSIPVHKYTLAPQVQVDNSNQVKGNVIISSSTISPNLVRDEGTLDDGMEVIGNILESRGVSRDYLKPINQQRQEPVKLLSKEQVQAYFLKRELTTRRPRLTMAQVLARNPDCLKGSFAYRARGPANPLEELEQIVMRIKGIQPVRVECPWHVIIPQEEDNCPWRVEIPPDAI